MYITVVLDFASLDIIDAQVHVWERNHLGHPWLGAGHGPAEVTPEETLALMDAQGVAGAIIVSAWSVYRFNPSYALAVAARTPDRFRVVAPIDLSDPNASAQVELLAAEPLLVGLRLMALDDADADLARAAAPEVLRAASEARLPVCMSCPHQLALVGELARAFPDVVLVVDHLGLVQPLHPPPPPDPFGRLPDLLALATLRNVFVKVTGLPTLSREPFPFADVSPALQRVLDAFGAERCMWGTDWTRTTELLSYADALRCYLEGFALTPLEREWLLGSTARTVFGWARNAPADSATAAALN